jgi:ARG and Rhodanese-Phosphatase-superfamily-associated Protein domain
MQIVADALSHIEIGSPVSFGNLTMFPLLNGNEDEPDYLTLDEAIAQGIVTITEISESGSVPELRFVNNGDLCVLLMDGEELIGAKQNRILNLTILAAARAELKIPVSCVERGRWSYRSEAFATAPRAQYAGARANKMSAVSSSLRESGHRVSDQQQVWQDIDGVLCELAVHSPTSAMSDIYDSYANDLDESVRAFPAVEGQAGAVFAINGEMIGLDLFDHASTLRKLLPKLVRSYALEALARREATDKSEVPQQTAAREFLSSVSEAKAERFAAIGEGEDVRVQEPGLSAAALVARGRLIHLCGFQIKLDCTLMQDSRSK